MVVFGNFRSFPFFYFYFFIPCHSCFVSFLGWPFETCLDIYMSNKSRRGVYMGTRPKTRYNDLISTSINDGRRGLLSHSHSHPYSHDIPRALCRSTGVVGWHWAFTLQGNGGDVWGAASARSSPVSLRYTMSFLFLFLFSFFVVYLIISPTPLYLFHLLVYLLRIFFSISSRCTPFQLWISFLFLYSRQRCHTIEFVCICNADQKED